MLRIEFNKKIRHNVFDYNTSAKKFMADIRISIVFVIINTAIESLSHQRDGQIAVPGSKSITITLVVNHYGQNNYHRAVSVLQLLRCVSGMMNYPQFVVIRTRVMVTPA